MTMLGLSKVSGLAAATALLGGAGYAASASVPAVASGAHVCSGSVTAPGVLAGSFGNVVVSGACFVNSGPATVRGNLTLLNGSALIAAFALNDQTGRGSSHLTVDGNLQVDAGATLLLGCLPTSFACIDDPNQSSPTLSSHDKIVGNLDTDAPLGVVVHNTWVGGDVSEVGGGGGFNCTPTGVFAVFGSPVYSTFEDSTIEGNLRIENLTSCWLGTARVHLAGSFRLIDNQLADPDAIEIVENHIEGNLTCRGNTTVWDSTENPVTGFYPRIPQPNQVEGTRSGQCVLSSPTTKHGKPGPGKF
jgi:hypothetical protein